MPIESNITPDAAPVITESEFLRFRDFFYRKSGIHFEESKRYFVDKRILQRIKDTGHDGFRDYFTFIRFQASCEELQQLTNLLTVNETYFFREEYQFKCMVESVLPEIVKNKRGSDSIRIWSVPSSTGEEPFSIALYLLEYWKDLEHVDVEIAASDIDTQVLEKARRGLFSERSVQNLPPEMLRTYFKPAAGKTYQLVDDVREAVSFSTVNLTDPTKTKGFKGYDLIFCRNLLIYFDNASRRQAAEAMFDALNPGGFVFLGHSESMSRISSLFSVRKFPSAIAYQKPLH